MYVSQQTFLSNGPQLIIGTLNSTVQVLEMTLMLKRTYQMVFMNFWYIKQYGARVGDDFVAKKN